MDKLTLVTLNVNGLSARSKRTGIFQLLLEKNPDICFLTETHARAKKIPKYTKLWQKMGGTNAIFEPAMTDGFKGVALLFGKNFNPQFGNTKHSIEGRSLSTEIEISGKKHKILVTYAPNQPRERRTFFEQISLLESTSPRP